LTLHYRLFIFDLDGTLTDPKVGITNSIQYALTCLGIKEKDKKYLTKFIGPPLHESFRKYYNMNDATARQAVGYYREYFADKGIFENQIHIGISDLLSKLDEFGFQLILATSKPTIYAEKILDYFRVRQYFDLVVGSNMDLTRTSKDEIITEVLRVIPDAKESGIVIGDRADDIMAARAHLMDSVAVGYGYGSEEELSAAKPTYVMHTVRELTMLLLGFAKQ